MSSFANGIIAAGACRVAEAAYSEVWCGRIILSTRPAPLPVYFKMVPARQFWSESGCHRLAEASGLPVGECFWATVSRDSLPSSEQWLPGETKRVVFAVVAQRGTTLAKLGHVASAKTMRGRDDFAKICVFDELVANGDRHTGNVMLDGRGRITLIDHGHAFGGPNHPLVDAFPVFENVLLRDAVCEMNARQRQAFALELSEAINEVREVYYVCAEALSQCHFRREITSFLGTRLSVLRDLLAQRLTVGNQLQLRLPTRPEFER